MESPHLRRRNAFICCAVALTLLLATVAGQWWWARHTQASTPVDLQGLPPLATGDWVFRLGSSADSVVVHTLGGGDYSHIGMVVAVAPQVLVVHATTDDDPQRLNQVLLSRLDDFLQPGLAKRFAIARPGFIEPAQQQTIAASLLKHVGEPFVLDIRDQPHRYCTTLLADAITVLLPTFQPAWTRLDNPLYRGDFLFPKAFSDYPGVEWVYRR